MTAFAGDTFSLSSIAAQKAALRSSARARRRALSLAARVRAASEAAKHLIKTLRGARHVAVYLSVQSELSTVAAIAGLHARGLKLYAPLPRADGRLDFLLLPRDARLRRGPLGLPRPSKARGRRGVVRLDAIVLPLLAFDAAGHRLGSGGGYYDRTLARVRVPGRPLKIGFAYALQETTLLPVENFDVPLDRVVTERGIIVCRRHRHD